jgi:hypothetical protein
LSEEFSFSRKRLRDFIKAENTCQVNEVPLEAGPLLEDLVDTLDDLLVFYELVKEVLDMRITLQHSNSELEFFEESD